MKLLTKELIKKFENYPLYSQDGKMGDAKVIAKFFNPVGISTWLITEGDILKDDNGNVIDIEMFGFVDLGGLDSAELGYVSLKELQDCKLPFGLTIERDLFYPENINLRDACKREFGKVPSMFMPNTKANTNVTVLQLINNNDNHYKRFESIKNIFGGVDSINYYDYERVYAGSNEYCNLHNKSDVFYMLENLYSIFNGTKKPDGYKGYSLSVSDVIILENDEETKAYYCDSVGFVALPDKFVNDYKQDIVYERVCKQFLALNCNQVFLQGNNIIVSAVVDSEKTSDIDINEITIDNYKDYENSFSSLGVYKSYKDLFKGEEISEGIECDLENLGMELYDSNGNWNYAISKEDIMALNSFGEAIDESLLENKKTDIEQEK